MDRLKIGTQVFAADAGQLIERIVGAEEAGLDCVWMTSGGIAPDPLAVYAAAARHTGRIAFGTSIIPVFPRHPLALAQSALVVDQLAPGRLRLGVGTSHKPSVESTYGVPFDRPHQYLREYLTILNGLFKSGEVSFHGERLHAEAKLPAPAGVQVLASALRPKGFRLCGELADGAISWVCPLPYIRDVAAPALAEGAAKAGRTAPPLVAHAPVVVSTNAGQVREAAAAQFGFYPRVPYYQQMFIDAGFPEAVEGKASDRMLDALVIHGDEDAVAERVRSMPEMGANELLASIVSIPDDRASYGRTLELLGALAKGA